MNLETIALRCTTCGAPLPKPQPGEEWVKCEYCGFLNKLVDATKYVEKLKRELEKWIREILPPTTTISTVADLAARHQIFQNIIKPKITMIKANVRAKYLQYVSNPLSPYPPPKEPGEDSRGYFEEALKIQTIREFAVSEDDAKLVNETIFFSNTTGYIINALKALSKYDIKSALKNVEEALNSIPSESSYELVKLRLNAVKTVISALTQIYDRNTNAAVSLAKTSIDLYNELMNKTSSTILPEANKGIVEIEKIIAEAIYNIADASHRYFTAGKDPLEIMKWIETYMKVYAWLRENYGRPIQDLIEISYNFKKFVYGKTGSPEISIVESSGSIYIPFHIIDCRFSYTKGFIFKKGSESRITLLVSSIIPYVENPVIDVLGLESGVPVKPEKISEYPIINLVNNVVSSAKNSSFPGDSRGFPPFITNVLAEKIADKYIEKANAKYRDKITFASTKSTGIIYIPFITRNQRILNNKLGFDLKLTIDFNNLVKLAL